MAPGNLLLAAALLTSFSALAQATPPATATTQAPAPQITRLTVAADGTGDYRTVQEAVNAVRDLSQVTVTIFIRNGVYREKLVVPAHKINVRLVGESREGTVISYADYSGDAAKHTTYTSYTVLVQGNDFTAENLTIANTAGPVGQAVALHVTGDRAQFRRCRLLGHQDTLFAAVDNSRQYYQDCYIEGTTDFIFGPATAVFEGCTLHSKKNSYLTAAATPPSQPYGFVFLGCTLTADSIAQKVYLGRPWRPHAKTVFLNTTMGPHITPAGWENWRNPANEKTAFYAEYRSAGPGATAAGRVPWAHQLTAKQARQYTLKAIFGGATPWLPAEKQ
ncbi:pectin esterase [Hymenobacter busanensis]|uniref:Pectinesterase n=1 Tax=Hymenobacter busanensis TaxID=2607656 RepID=A0A7L4ZWX1_9BACT|nr:pectinesterase family protein [Hymenobacter busanensis]KAA9332318.1 pectin esterase [Hymenobacter busanensis]QHJ07345.1 pectin esterase [Hymenobacter busanensis]